MGGRGGNRKEVGWEKRESWGGQRQQLSVLCVCVFLCMYEWGREIETERESMEASITHPD